MRWGRWRSETGQVFIIVALTLPVLLGAAAIVVDVGNLYFQKRTLRGAADAAALAAAMDLNRPTCVGGSCVGGLTGKYSGANGGTPTLANLPACPAAGNCYVYPYNLDDQKVLVQLKKSVPTAFARIFGINTVSVTARAVASVAPGLPPPYTFISLNNEDCSGKKADGEKHTLLVKLGGVLTVTGKIYVNSCNSDDGFDIFGVGGQIHSPEIRTVGGWETHNNDTVHVGGTECPVHDKFDVGDPWQPGCPFVGQPVLADPFAGQITDPTPAAIGACVQSFAAPTPTITTTNEGAPPVAAVNEVEVVTINQTTGTFTLTFNGVTTVPINWNAGAGGGAGIDAALENTIAGAGNDFLVARTGTGPITVTFQGVNAGFNVTELIATKVTGVGGDPTVTTTTQGAPASGGNEVQVVTVNQTTGTFTLTFNGVTTVPINWDAGAGGGAGIDAALENTIAGAGNDFGVARTGTGPITVTFQGVNAGVNVPQMTGATSVPPTTTGTKDSPAPCVITTNTTLDPGTYYGGIFIGNPAQACDTTHNDGNAQVVLRAGTYILAGGGLSVCGSSSVTGPGGAPAEVMLFNSIDPDHPTGAGALAQIVVNTTGSVKLGPQTSGPYDGLTIYQPVGQAILPDQKCDGRTPTDDPGGLFGSAAEWDIAFLDMADLGGSGTPSGRLGSISGTIYAPHPHALFGETVAGQANLAIITGCIYISAGVGGVHSTFDFQAEGLFGVGSALTE